MYSCPCCRYERDDGNSRCYRCGTIMEIDHGEEEQTSSSVYGASEATRGAEASTATSPRVIPSHGQRVQELQEPRSHDQGAQDEHREDSQSVDVKDNSDSGQNGQRPVHETVGKESRSDKRSVDKRGIGGKDRGVGRGKSRSARK